MNALAQLRRAEETLSLKDAEFTKLQSENRRLNSDLGDLQSQLEQVRRAAAVKLCSVRGTPQPVILVGDVVSHLRRGTGKRACAVRSDRM